jgi:hypothetical protein
MGIKIAKFGVISNACVENWIWLQINRTLLQEKVAKKTPTKKLSRNVSMWL